MSLAQVLTCEGPVEQPGTALIALLKRQDAIFKVEERIKDVGPKNFATQDWEEDLDLVKWSSSEET